MPEQLPDNAVVGETTHVEDHNLLSTAVSNIDDRVANLELTAGGTGVVEIAKQASPPNPASVQLWIDTDDIVSSETFVGPTGPAGPVGASGPFEVPEWQPGWAYSVGDSVLYNGGIWRMKELDPFNGKSPYPEVVKSTKSQLNVGQTWTFQDTSSVATGDKIVVMVAGGHDQFGAYVTTNLTKVSGLDKSYNATSGIWNGIEVFYQDVSNINVFAAPTLTTGAGVTSGPGMHITSYILRHAATGTALSYNATSSSANKDHTIYPQSTGPYPQGTFSMFNNDNLTLNQNSLMLCAEMVKVKKYTGAVPEYTLAATTLNNNWQGMAFPSIAGSEVNDADFVNRLDSPVSAGAPFFLSGEIFTEAFHKRVINGVSSLLLNRYVKTATAAPSIAIDTIGTPTVLKTVENNLRAYVTFAGNSGADKFNTSKWELLHSLKDGAGEVPIDGRPFISSSGSSAVTINLKKSHQLNVEIDERLQASSIWVRVPGPPAEEFATASLNLTLKNIAGVYNAPTIQAPDYGYTAVTPKVIKWSHQRGGEGQVTFRWNRDINRWEPERASGNFVISFQEPMLSRAITFTGDISMPPVLVSTTFRTADAIAKSNTGTSITDFMVGFSQILGADPIKRVYDRCSVEWLHYANDYPGGTFNTGLYAPSYSPGQAKLFVFNDNYSPGINFCNIFIHEVGHMLDLSATKRYMINGSDEGLIDHGFTDNPYSLALSTTKAVYDIWLKTAVMPVSGTTEEVAAIMTAANAPGQEPWTVDKKYRSVIKKYTSVNLEGLPNTGGGYVPVTWAELINPSRPTNSLEDPVSGSKTAQGEAAEFVAECFSLWMATKVLPGISWFRPHGLYPEPVTLANQFTTHSLKERIKQLVPPQYPTLLLDMFALFEQIDWVKSEYMP